MQHVFSDTVTSAQIINGVVRIGLGVAQRNNEPDAKMLTKETAELLMPIAGFTDMANACNRIAAELVEKGLLNKGDTPQVKVQS
jgi:hypothetical protein